MMILDTLTSALGPPQFLRLICDERHPLAAVARWHHRGARVDFGDADTTHVVFNVSGGQRVDLHGRERSTRHTIRAGSIAIVTPGNPARVTVSGEADTVQIIITPHLLKRVDGVSTPLANDSLPLQAAAAQALVAVANDQEPGLYEIVHNVARVLARTGTTHARGGLATAARQRVRTLIDQSLQRDPFSPPTLGELANAANLSLHHFVRAYRQTEGLTPYARVIRRRLDAALALLLQHEIRVDEIADMMGFSSPSHFISTFRKHIGVTPGALRKAVRPRCAA